MRGVTPAPFDTRRKSRTILNGRDRAPTRALLKAIGFTGEDYTKPMVGVSHSWTETMPCNINHRTVAADVKRSIRAAGGTPMEINMIAMSHGVPLGTEDMRASLISRELMADSIELASLGHLFEAVVLIGGCDNAIPACAMGYIRAGVPDVIVCSGTIAPGTFQGRPVVLPDVYEAVGPHAAGKIIDAEFKELDDSACPGPSACGGEYTANPMAMVMQFLGLSPTGSASPPAVDPDRERVSLGLGEVVMKSLSPGLDYRSTLIHGSFENVIRGLAASAGSTNSVLHLLAIAREASVNLTVDHFDRIRAETPIIADMKPGVQYTAYDLHHAGGTVLVGRRLLEAGLLNAHERTIDGRTIVAGDVVVIRYQGPKGGPGVPEMFDVSSALVGQGLGWDVALITDGRFSDAGHGFLIGQVCPAAADGGAVALVEEGDTITIDLTERVMNLEVSELAERLARCTPPGLRYERGVYAKYAAAVGPATDGATTCPGLPWVHTERS